MSDECQKPHMNGQCCCNCQYHLRDMSHPGTDGNSIMLTRGWVCAPPEFDGVFSGWSEHGVCEMWQLQEPTTDAGGQSGETLKLEGE